MLLISFSISLLVGSPLLFASFRNAAFVSTTAAPAAITCKLYHNVSNCNPLLTGGNPPSRFTVNQTLLDQAKMITGVTQSAAQAFFTLADGTTRTANWNNKKAYVAVGAQPGDGAVAPVMTRAMYVGMTKPMPYAIKLVNGQNSCVVTYAAIGCQDVGGLGFRPPLCC
jgi:hypothetical protein